MRWSAIIILLAPSAFAAQPEASQALEPLSSPYLLKLTGGLLLIVVAIFALAWLLRKFNVNPAAAPGLIRIVAGINVGARDRILLLQVGDEQILVGLGSGHMAHLHTLKEPLEAPAGQVVGGAFAARLAGLMDGGGSKR